MPKIPFADEGYQALNRAVPGLGQTARDSTEWFTDPQRAADRRMADSGYNPNIANYDFYQQIARSNAGMAARQNPYSDYIANQNRAAQMALVQQMMDRTMNQGQSIAGQQGGMALAQNARSALGAMGQGPLGSAGVANRMAGIGAGLAGNIGAMRSQEVLGGLGSGFGAASALRGGDLSVAGDQVQAALRQRALDDAARQFFASQGSRLQQTQAQQALEGYKLQQRLRLLAEQGQLDAVKGAANTAGTFAGMVA